MRVVLTILHGQIEVVFEAIRPVLFPGSDCLFMTLVSLLLVVEHDGLFLGGLSDIRLSLLSKLELIIHKR